MRNLTGHVLDRLYNLHWLEPGVARSAQPYLGFYRFFLARHGFRGLINLRGINQRHGWWRQEKHIAEEAGIAHFDVKLSSRKIPTRALLTELFDAFEQSPKPLLMKCSGGQDRTALAAALYLLHAHGGDALPAAEAQFAAWPYLHLPRNNQIWLQHLPRYAREDSAGLAFALWARTRYEPGRFADWLHDHGLTGSYSQIQPELPPAPAHDKA